jgi:hypothetical protein
MPTHRFARTGLLAGACLAVLAVLLSACTTISDPSPTASPAGPEPTLATGSAGPTAVPTDVGATPPPSLPSQSDTEWARIWDALPEAFPEYPGASPAETGEGPASAILDVGDTDPAVVAAYYVSALEFAGYHTLSGSEPREDGSIEVEWAGETTCRILITITPMGGTTFVTILYRADCPFE